MGFFKRLFGEAKNLEKIDPEEFPKAEFSNIDDDGCELCKYLDGQIIDTTNPWIKIIDPPLHDECSCTLIYISKEEVGSDEIKINFMRPPVRLIEKCAPHLMKYIRRIKE